MNDKMILISIVAIIATSMLIGVLFEMVPKLIRFIIEKGVPLLVLVSITRNVFFIKDLIPKLKELATNDSIQGMLHRCIYYAYTLLTVIVDYVVDLLKTASGGI